MTKYNKKEIMLNAWRLVKSFFITISEALIKAWAGTKDKKSQNADHTLVEVARETEKAICVNAKITNIHTDKSFTKMVWIPKSLVKNENEVPNWFLGKKVSEISEEFNFKCDTEIKISRFVQYI